MSDHHAAASSGPQELAGGDLGHAMDPSARSSSPASNQHLDLGTSERRMPFHSSGPSGSSGAPASSASAYAPLGASLSVPDGMASPPMSYPDGFGGTVAHPSTQSLWHPNRPPSWASSNLLNANDYDSVHALNRSARGSTLGAFTPGEEYAMHEKTGGSTSPDAEGQGHIMGGPAEAKGWRSYSDPRAAGLKRYGKAGEKPLKRKILILGLVALALAIVVVAVVVPITQTLLKDDNDNKEKAGEATETTNGNEGTGPEHKVLTSGGDGSEIRLDDGSTFIYKNSFGGEWRSGLLDDGARAQSYTPRLNETWQYGKDRILGVNFGGWLVIEPFISPGLFEPYQNGSTATINRVVDVVDEYTLCVQWASENALETKMRQHYDTFITEKDFADVAAAGLNWIRLPIGFWALETVQDEPFLKGVAWEYFLKAIKWARKYGLRINLDLHAVPGSQNNYNHSGRLGAQINFLNGPMGYLNAQRTLNYIRTLTQFISQPEIAKVVPMFSVLNEPNLPQGIGMNAIRSFYGEVYNIVRGVTGTGEGKGPYITIHDGFMGLQQYSGFLANADRVAWDIHPYVAFTPPYQDWGNLVQFACNGMGSNMEYGLSNLGVTVGGEWSLATNDCGLYLNGVYDGVRFDGSYSANGQSTSKTGDCPFWDDWQNFTQQQKNSMKDTARAQHAALGQGGGFFWTWKIGNSLRTNAPVNPNWSYKLGLDQGWMPSDPNSEADACSALASSYSGITRTTTWSGTFSDWQTGKASTYAPQTASNPWPPTTLQQISNAQSALQVSTLPSYTATGAILTAPVPTLSVSIKGDATPTLGAWANPADTAPMYTAVAGCSYPNPYGGTTASYNGFPCSGTPAPTAAQRRDVGDAEEGAKRMQIQRRMPVPTPAPGQAGRRSSTFVGREA